MLGYINFGEPNINGMPTRAGYIRQQMTISGHRYISRRRF